jgi:hypothetical protein
MPPTTPRTARPKTRTVPSNLVPLAEGPTEEQIRMRAYEIYLARNGAPGSPEADWRQAEEELRGRMALLGRP